MTWAARRRSLILLIIGAVLLAFSAVVSIAFFYQTPSCADNVRNQDEEGVDCGGSCPYLCAAQKQPPTVLFTKVLTNGAGRADIIAMVENKNAGVAAKNVPYNISLYGADRLPAGEVSGTLDLPPGATVPVYAPKTASGERKVASAFLSIDPSSPRWFAMPDDPRIVPTVLTTAVRGTVSAPRIEAGFMNAGVSALTNVRAIVLVYNADKEVIAASSTIVPLIPAQGQASATFTWNDAFPGTPALIQVVPLIPLP